MTTAAPKGGGAESDRKPTRPGNSILPAAAAQVATPDLPGFRARLVAARARLIERIILEYDPAHTYPSTAWVRMVADLHITILAVDAMMADAIVTPPNRRP